jgi:glycerol-3-phosphate acyltransferase PlsY
LSPALGLALVAGAYLLGSVSFSVVLVRLLHGLDVRTVGSGNAGATNAMRAAGKKAGVAVLFLDLIKGVTAVAVPRALDAPGAVVGGAAFAVVLGHVFPAFFNFRGGKGVATSAGALGTLAPAAMALGLVVFFAVVTWKRFVSLGSVVTAVLFPLLAGLGARLGWSEYGGPWLVLSSSAIAALIVLKHRRNLERLWRGTEPRLGEGRGKPAGLPDVADIVDVAAVVDASDEAEP